MDSALIEKVAKAMAGSNWEQFDPKIHGSPANRLAAQRMWLRFAEKAVEAMQ